jgi:hypothetical protein
VTVVVLARIARALKTAPDWLLLPALARSPDARLLVSLSRRLGSGRWVMPLPAPRDASQGWLTERVSSAMLGRSYLDCREAFHAKSAAEP